MVPKTEATAEPKPKKKKVSKPHTAATTKATAKKTPKSSGKREGTKTTIVLDLLKRKDGATVAELMAATGWQQHSLRGFLSGALKKRMGLKIASSKSETGERSYMIKS